jgi:hypothetical protein
MTTNISSTAEILQVVWVGHWSGEALDSWAL